MFNVGTAKIDSALELELTGRPIAWLGAAPALIEVNRWWMEPHFLQEGDTWSLNFRSWILRVDDKVIVIDPCNGNGRPNPMSMFDMLDIPFLERFEATGNRVGNLFSLVHREPAGRIAGGPRTLRGGRYRVPTDIPRFLEMTTSGGVEALA